MTAQDIAGNIQHTLYDVGTGRRELEKHCLECVTYQFNAAMVPARLVADAVTHLAGTAIAVVTAVDFPIGLMTDAGRVAEGVAAVEAGATQVDLAVPIGLLRSGEDDAFRRSIAHVVEAIAPVEVKVMLELPLLTRDETDRAVRLSVDAGAQWLKNASSGSVGTATLDQVALLRTLAPDGVRVKASGGIHTEGHVRALLAAGAELVGTSSGVAIVQGTHPGEGGY